MVIYVPCVRKGRLCSLYVWLSGRGHNKYNMVEILVCENLLILHICHHVVNSMSLEEMVIIRDVELYS